MLWNSMTLSMKDWYPCSPNLVWMNKHLSWKSKSDKIASKRHFFSSNTPLSNIPNNQIVRVNKQQSCIKPSVHRGCVHTHTLTAELLRAIRRGCGGTHALQKERNLSLACHTSWEWRHPCLLKGQNRIFSLHASTLTVSVVILLRSFTGIAPCSCFFGGIGF